MRTLVFALLALAACSKKSASPDEPPHKPTVPRDAAVAAPPVTWYRIEVKYDDLGLIPFAIGVDRDKPEGWIVESASENLPLVVLQRDPMRLRIPVRGAELSFAPDKDGVLRGTWNPKFYFKRDFPLTAKPIPTPDIANVFPSTEAPTVDFSGSWTVDVEEFGISRGTFTQSKDGSIVGTLIPPEIGDIRTLRGRVSGGRAQLSVFDGIHCFLVELAMGADGKSLIGRWLVSGIGEMQLKGERDDKPPTTHLEVSAHMAPGKTRVTLDGLEQPPYLGNPVIIDYFGSWCPVCIDLTPELVRIYNEHAKEGLQIFSVAAEPTTESEGAAPRLDEFRKAYNVPWPFHVRYTEDFVGSVPPEVLGATGFPVTIFLRRDHTVSAIHTGFVSKAAPAEHEAVVKLIEKMTADILASPPAKPPPKK